MNRLVSNPSVLPNLINLTLELVRLVPSHVTLSRAEVKGFGQLDLRVYFVWLLRENPSAI